MEEPRIVFTNDVQKEEKGTVTHVVICEDGLASRGTIEYMGDDGEIKTITAVTNSTGKDFEEGEEVALTPLK